MVKLRTQHCGVLAQVLQSSPPRTVIEEIYFFVFFYGHAGMANYNYLYLNEPEMHKKIYGLEYK